MKATLIKLETRDIEVPDRRPYYREVVRDGYGPLIANYEGMEPTAIEYPYKTIDYRLVQIRGGNQGEDGFYMVNDDMWYKAIPILEDVVRVRLRPLQQENVDLKLRSAYLSDTLTSIEKKWWYKLIKKLGSLLPTFKQK